MTSTTPPRKMKLGNWLIWTGFMALVLLLPLVLRSNGALTFLCQISAIIVFCLSYNMLFGQTGMLSFGHAVYSGLGAFFAVHAMNLSAAAKPLTVPLPLIPLVGGLAGLFFGLVFGYLTTKRAGTTFAMITLGIAELVFAFSQVLPGFFGGETGITSNRVYGTPLFGISFGPTLQLYYLVAGWLIVCTASMYAFTRTPLGRIANAVRDNPERVEFVGYDTRRVRYTVLAISAFFAGISGGMVAVTFEVAGIESLSIARSGDALFFTFIGGSGSFGGPILGGVIGALLMTKLSDFSAAWQLYLGVLFVLMVMYSPGGFAALIAGNWNALRSGNFSRILPAWLATLFASGMVFLGAVLVIEISYGLTFGLDKAVVLRAFNEHTHLPAPVGLAAGLLIATPGFLALRWAKRRYAMAWRESSAARKPTGDGQ